MNKHQYDIISRLTVITGLAVDSNTLKGTKLHPLKDDVEKLKLLCTTEEFESIVQTLKILGFEIP